MTFDSYKRDVCDISDSLTLHKNFKKNAGPKRAGHIEAFHFLSAGLLVGPAAKDFL